MDSNEINDNLIATNRREIKKILNTHGVCIVNNVLNRRECRNLKYGMLDAFSHLTSNMEPQFNVNDTNTWDVLKLLFPTDNMLYQHWGLGQSQFVWDVRCNPKVIDIFASIYNTDDLLVSFDGISFMLPSEYTNQWFSEDKYHIDQSLKKNDFECVQGWINGFNTNPGDATLKVLLGSHRFHKEYADTIPNEAKTSDWNPVKDVDFFLTRGCIEHRIVAPKGSLVLWDSRTVHYGSKPLSDREKYNFRAVVYVCYTPRSLITEANRKRKIKIFEDTGKLGQMRMTNHWPHRPKMFPEFPRWTSGKLPNINPLPRPIIPEKYRKLIGYN